MNMAEILLDNYCFPENLVGMQEAIEQAISSGEILHISDRKTLAAVLTAGVQGALNDPRLVVSYEPNYTPATPATLPYQSPEQLKSIIKSSIKVEVLQNNIGYLRMDHIIGKEIAEETGSLFLERVWNKVFQTSSLVLDLRYATTGDLSGIPYIVSFFSDAGMLTHIDTVYDRPSNTTTELWTMPSFLGERYGKRRDLIILTSKRTIGVAEGVAYLLKHLKRALVVGERSAGGSVRIEKLRIGEFDFYITVPVTRSLSPLTGQSWEVSGVSPCVDVSAKDALDEAKSLLVVRASFPKAVQGVSDIIRNFYSFTDKIPTLIQHLASTDFFSITSEEGLAAKLNYELQSIAEDPRLNIKVMLEPPVVIEEAQEPNHIPDDPSFLEALIDTVFKVNILSGNTGYVRFDEFIEAPILVKFGEQIFKNVWDPIRDTKNLIIDLRFNSGGPLTAVPVLLSYLHDSTPPVHFFTVYNRMDNITTEFHTLTALPGTTYGSQRGVYVLTSYHTATAGEEFAYLTQSLRRATVIGEITSGTLLHSKSFQVEDTNIVITVPIMNFIDNNGECWLGGGVVPDAIVLAEDAMEQAHRIIAFHEEVCNLVELAGDLLKVHYAIPEVAINVTRVLKSKWAEGSYRAVVDYESLASQLTADLQETSGDHRLNIFYCDTEPEVLQNLPKIPSPDEVQDIINTFFKLEILPENIGYLRVDMMPGTEVLKIIASQLVDLVWIKLVNTDTLVIDIRFNTGGSSSAIPFLCTYFFEPEPLRHLYSVFNRSTGTMTEVMTLPEVPGPRYSSQKDIYVLTSHMTGSAAEAFARAMKELGRATIVGEPTVGGTLSSGTYQIGDSILYASIPNNVVLSAVTGKVWSISGVEPHVAAQAKDALYVAQKIIETELSPEAAVSGQHKMAKMLLPLALLVILSNVLAVHCSFPPTLVSDIAKIFMDNYCYPKKLGGLKEAIEAASNNTEILSIQDPRTLASVLTTGLQKTINDPRLVISYDPDYIPAKPPVLPPLPPEQLITIIKSSIKLEVLENNVGYLRIDRIIGEEMAEKIGPLLVENVWNKIVPTSALIFDLRYTASGEMSGVPYIVSYFSEAEPLIHIDTIYDRPLDTTTELWSMTTLLGERYGKSKDLIILTSKNTKGVAEAVSYALKNLKRATIVGEKTAGGSVKIDKLKLGDTDFYFDVPTVSSTSPITGQSWEINGVTPCIEVDAEDALDAAVAIINLRAKIPAIIQAVGVLVEDNYAFADTGANASETLLGLLEKGHYSMIASQEELETQLSSDLKELFGDKCLAITHKPGKPPMANLPPEMLVEMIKSSFHTDVLENNIGYLCFDAFGDYEQVAPIAKVVVENVWNKVVDTDAMIIDLRNNLGGSTSAISGFCSYFFDGEKPLLLDTLYTRPTETTTEMWTLAQLTGKRYGQKKSIIILTSGATASAAEEFVYIMKKLGRAMIVGETTNGGCHPPEHFHLADGNMYLSIPVTHSDTTHGPAWEGAGISPHIPVPADAALDTAREILNKHLRGQK
ncbi:retinol-binding protein 3-like [Scleropages formosus]|uniref:Retinol-binding protein 3-like n=1 Tax=Scleropages formosus TaxID=113540 RepID=A0A0P7X4R4_SCLFO|nr:retinol-binding protein 3-like [Scleropages formosus]